MSQRILITILIFLNINIFALSTYDAVLEGKSCHESNSQQISCSYKVGNDLHIEIAGIGLEDTGIAFLKSDFKGDYYGKFGMLHGCVIIKGLAFADYAFISPKNGKVYTNWQNCRDQK
jgi:hypothetical protein